MTKLYRNYFHLDNTMQKTITVTIVWFSFLFHTFVYLLCCFIISCIFLRFLSFHYFMRWQIFLFRLTNFKIAFSRLYFYALFFSFIFLCYFLHLFFSLFFSSIFLCIIFVIIEHLFFWWTSDNTIHLYFSKINAQYSKELTSVSNSKCTQLKQNVQNICSFSFTLWLIFCSKQQNVQCTFCQFNLHLDFKKWKIISVSIYTLQISIKSKFSFLYVIAE